MEDEKKSVHQIGSVNISGGQVTAHTIAGQIVGNQISHVDLDHVFQPILEAARSASPETQHYAVQKAEQLKVELAKGKGANDGVMAKLLDGIVSLAPDAVKAVLTAFGTPILSNLVGPVTRFVLDKISGQ